MDVLRQQGAPGARLAPDQQRDIRQLRIQRAQQLRQLQIREPAREARRNGRPST